MTAIQSGSDPISPVRSKGNGNSGGVFSLRNVSERFSLKDHDNEDVEGEQSLKQDGDIRKKQVPYSPPYNTRISQHLPFYIIDLHRLDAPLVSFSITSMLLRSN